MGRNVVVIGGGMTAVDAAVQSRLLGRTQSPSPTGAGGEDVGLSLEQDLATSKGVRILHNVMPVAVHGMALRRRWSSNTLPRAGGAERHGERFRLPADQVLAAIGQTLAADAGLEIAGARSRSRGGADVGSGRLGWRGLCQRWG